MPRRIDAAACWALAFVLAVGTGCSGPAARSVEVGRHRVRFVLPKGWEHLDHGRQQLFRRGDAEISLVDLGPGTRDVMVAEFQSARSLWQAGRRPDALQRVGDLRGPALRFATSEQRAEFWKPWTDVTYIPGRADSSAIGAAFEALIEGTRLFAEVTPERMLEYVLLQTSDMRRREIRSRDQRTVHGSVWVEVETWDRVSHLYRSRLAVLENHGYLLVLAVERGTLEQAGPAFEDLLQSLEVTANAR